MFIVPIVALLSVFIGTPSIVFSFIYFMKKQKNELVKLNKQKEILELEIRRDEMKIRALELESRSLDTYLDR